MVRNSAKVCWNLRPHPLPSIRPKFEVPPAVRFGCSSMPLDPRGLNCPSPALRTRKMLSGLAYGDRLSVKCTDPLAVIDIPHRLRETGDTLECREAARASLLYSMSSAERHG